MTQDVGGAPELEIPTVCLGTGPLPWRALSSLGPGKT